MDVQFRSVVESLTDAVLLVSPEGTIGFANHAAEYLLGYAAGELLDRPLEAMLPGRCPIGQAAGVLARCRDGSDLRVDVNLSPLPEGGIAATLRDASCRLRLESDLRSQAEELDAAIAQRDAQAGVLHTMVDAISDGVIVLDRVGRVQLINPPALRMYPAARLDSKRPPFAKIVEKSGAFLSDQTTPCRIDELVVSRTLAGQNVDGLEVFIRHSLPSEGIWTVMSGRPLKDDSGAVTGAVLVICDITERKSALEAVMVAQEAERKRIARELHDSTTQILCAVILEMEKIVGEMPADADLRSRAFAQKERLVELADEVSSVAHRLHPAVLERVGLSEAMERVCREFHTKGLHVEFSQRNISQTVSASSALCVYRVAQEGLRNVLRHSRSKNATVSLVSDGSALHLSIIDSGVGFDVEAAAAKGRLGLVSIRERVRLAGGSLSIQSEPGHGARIEVTIPAPRAALAAHRQ